MWAILQKNFSKSLTLQGQNKCSILPSFSTHLDAVEAFSEFMIKKMYDISNNLDGNVNVSNSSLTGVTCSYPGLI